MSESDTQLEHVELSIERAQEAIDKSDALTRLSINKDFINIIQEGYFEKEASRIVLTKADPAVQDVESQKALDNTIIAIGHLRQYFITLHQLGRMSSKAIEDDKNTREEILAGNS